MRLLSSVLMVVSMLGLTGCIVEPATSRPPSVYASPPPSVDYNRRPPGDYDRDHAFREHDEHDHESRSPRERDHDYGRHDEHDHGDRPPEDRDHRPPG